LCHTAMNTPRVCGRNTYQPTEMTRYATHRPKRQSRSVAEVRIEEILPRVVAVFEAFGKGNNRSD
jgi:hypothetical protein